MLASTPTSGCSRNSHIKLATATDVATVEEKIVRKKPTPLTALWARTASPTPSANPSGTVISANLNVTQSAFWNSVERNTSTYWSQPFERQLAPFTSQRWLPSTTARASGYTTNVTSTMIDGANSSSAAGNCFHRCLRPGRDATPVTLGHGWRGTRACALFGWRRSEPVASVG